MTDQPAPDEVPETGTENSDEAIGTSAPISMREFLESAHPSSERHITKIWVFVAAPGRGGGSAKVLTPELRLHCPHCKGERTFRLLGDSPVWGSIMTQNVFLTYLCGDCRKSLKRYSLKVTRVDGTDSDNGAGVAYKYGEEPPYGVPVPSKLLRLFGKDSATFLKGRRCENQGLGIGAFAYYRRVVETHRNDIFDALLKVCDTLHADAALVDELKAAKKEVSFSKSVEVIKSALPQGLLIDGHNPLLALHSALSVGLHSQSDEACLEAAQDVRLVLTDLVEKMASLREENTGLKTAIQRLMAKRETENPVDF